MQKNNHKLFSAKNIILVIVLVAFLGGGTALALRQKNNSDKAKQQTSTTTSTESKPKDGINLDPPTEEEKSQAEAEKVDRIENPASTTPASDSVQISKVSQNSDSKSVVVTTQLEGNSWSACDLTFSKDGISFSKTAKVIFQSSFSSCLGFSAEGSEFSDNGKWSVSLKATKTDGSFQTSASKTVDVVK